MKGDIKMLANLKTNGVLIVFCLLVFCSDVCFANDKFPELKGPYLGQTPPGKTPEIFAPGIISHGFHENGIVFSPDGNELFYSTSDNKYTTKILIYLKRDNNKWSTPGIAPFSGSYYDHSIFFSPDGQKLFFSSQRPFSSNADSKKDLDVWIIEKDGDSWGKPVHLDSPLNTDKSEQITSIAANGTIYLRTNYQGKGKWAIYISRLEKGKYTAAEKLDKTINKGYNEGNPFISPDESFLLFKSSRPGGYGKTDLYVSFRQKDKSWGEPVNLGDKINSPEYELEPRLSPDGKYLFFTSFRTPDPSVFKGKSYKELMKLYRSPQNGYGTLYWVDAKIIQDLKPEEYR
jgi:Tol biopolymer transport system component